VTLTYVVLLTSVRWRLQNCCGESVWQ